jgi:hypothetical protein
MSVTLTAIMVYFSHLRSLEYVGNEPGLGCMMERCDWELKFVRQLGQFRDISMHVNAAAVSGDTNANDIVEIHRFVAMIGDLNDKFTTVKECKEERFKP